MAQKKHTYSATFGDGKTITRKTARTYTRAWRTFEQSDGKTIASGFSGDKRMAEAQVGRYCVRAGVAGETVEAELVPEGFETLHRCKTPYRIKRIYQGDDPMCRSYFETGAARKHLRFATEKEAQAWIDETAVRRVGVTWEVVKDAR